ncbi:MAG TPA: hypothetical protein VMY76_14095 [Gemmatimonadales bacterium]|nr:hypothetical protein [Gemmatimonadales bacterium]
MRSILLAVTLLQILGCTGTRTERPPSAADARARDSVIGASRLPGAGGVRGAMRAADSAGSRRAQEDAANGDSR